MSALDCSDGFNAAEVRLVGLQRPKALAIAKEPLHCCVVARDQIVAPIEVEVPTRDFGHVGLDIEMRDKRPSAAAMALHDILASVEER